MFMNSKEDRATGVGRDGAVEENRTATNQFVLEAALLATSLEAISMRSAKSRIAEEVESGFQSYAELLRRRESLRLTSEDERALQQIMQQIRTRLNYLKVWRLGSSREPQESSE